MVSQANKIKIAFCIPDMIIGGLETVFVNTVNELLRHPDVELRIITHAKVREPLYANWLRRNREIPVYVYYPLCNWFEDLSPKCRGILKPIRKITFSLYKKYRRFIVVASGRFKDVDVFVDYKNFEFAKELKYYNRPKIAWAHSALSYFESNGGFGRASQYDKIVGITDDFCNEFQERYPQYSDKIVRIYNPMNMAHIRQLAKSVKAPQGKYFCHVSRLCQGKDIKTLLDAFDLFDAANTGVELYVVGDGDMADEFQEYARTLKSSPRIVFTGALRNPYGIMRGAIANILSSEYEGLPTVVLESLILGVPCISSNCKNGPREILMDGNAGILFEPGNSDELSQILSDLWNKRIDTQAMAANINKSLSRFKPETIAGQFIELVNEIKRS